VSEFPYLPLETKGWRMAMGLRPLDIDHWLEVDEGRESELEQKRRLLERAYDVVSRRTEKVTQGVANCSPK